MILILSPVYLIVYILVRCKLGAPVLFTQKRPGKDGVVFEIYKFRTMIDAFDEQGTPLPDDVRLTRFGSLLRSTSLDELPEIFNILKGEMSFVGPRPLLVQYLPLYNTHQKRRHDARPGLTGWAQVNGRNRISWEERFDFDVWYVDHMNFLLDIKILFMTVFKVFKRSDINSDYDATMEDFLGSDNI